ncbi:MAG TPA: DUF427 domain-containing protein [Solirubrobacteraceae bacterium]|nr:DUF427 domain-containing protein [Solirubrobacteraceae bacterium]
MRAIYNDVTIADSEDTIVIEGNHYVPPDSVRWEHLSPSRSRSVCPWKGVAGYYHVSAGGSDARSAAWTYRRPFPWIREIRDHVAFWGPVEIRP